jgi:DNA polymerase-3 subunit alpha
MFDGGPSEKEPVPDLPAAPKPLTSQEIMALDKELLGVYLGEHPLDQHLAKLGKVITHTCQDARAAADREQVRIAGVLSAVRQYYTKGKNEAMFFLTLEDKTGSIPVTLFPRGTAEFGDLCLKDSIVLIEGKVSYRDRIATKAEGEGGGVGAEIVAEKIQSVANAEAQLVSVVAEEEPVDLHIRVDRDTRTRLPRLRELLTNHSGEDGVFLHVLEGEDSITVQPGICVSADDEFVGYLRNLLGAKDTVWTARK